VVKCCKHVIGGDECHKSIEGNTCSGIGSICTGRRGGMVNGKYIPAQTIDLNIDPGNITMPDDFIPECPAPVRVDTHPPSRPFDVLGYC
jgi:hypothetical protein